MGELPTPEPGKGEVRVKLEACGLNPSDYQRAEYGVPDWEWPAVLGLDVVGVIDELGEGVTDFEVGTRVAYNGDIRARGGFAEFTIVDGVVLAPVPEGVSSTQAAALPSAGLTAYQSIVRRLRVDADDTVLITGGAGGVGGFAVQLAHATGAHVFATEGSRNLDRVRELGAEAVIDFAAENISERVLELTDGRGVDVILDTIGTESATANLALLAFEGRLASTAGRPDMGDLAPFSVGPAVHEIALGAAHTTGDLRARRELATMLSELLALVNDGTIDAMVSRTVSINEVPEALTQLANRKASGKFVMDLTETE
ncbi:zinc-binding dehydrogenase [Brevibacterium zhoupengii]|uniref:zinc-binding dehydrogenase n=1 Tax=Brevibacterium zhoupengii TaxID=2898795 RepID=UPI001E446A20|nr:zinc-binding dehydrogenase [Brevibacterium zhoupengii]